MGEKLQITPMILMAIIAMLISIITGIGGYFVGRQSIKAEIQAKADALYEAQFQAILNQPDPPKGGARIEAIHGPVDDGYFQKVSFTTTPAEIWVTQKFLFAKRPTQSEMLKGVWSVLIEQVGNAKRIAVKIDNGTKGGNEIGSYNPEKGWVVVDD